jgi:mxaJ protein
MCSAFLRGLALLLALTAAAEGRELRVCADPNNLPFSNDRQEGFENKIIAIVAQELHAELDYVWWAQRRGMVTEALNTGICDLIPGIAEIDGLLLTYPAYYRSSYAFIEPADAPVIEGFDDPRLKDLRVGIQLIGDDGVNTPPAEALAERGVIQNVRGYSLLDDYRRPNPPARIVKAVADGEIDIALAWGPMAGYFAKHQSKALRVTPVAAPFANLDLPMAFDIHMGLRLDEGALRQEVEGALERRRADVDAVLAQYGVPRLDRPGGTP